MASRGRQRLASAALALLGAVIAARLTAYQLGWTAPPWEPFFGDGSQRVLRSAFSRALPFPDAGLGLVAYLAEIVTLAWMSAARRRDSRRPVHVYASIALGMAVGSVGLVVLQAAVIHAFCTLCLTSALLSFALAVPAATELIATWKRGDRDESFGRR